MRKENIAFLLAGLAFGSLIGFGLFKAVENQPSFSGATQGASAIPSPQGPAAPNQIVGGGGAPMVKRVNELKRALQENPQSLSTLVELANLYHDAGMWPEAVSYYERAVTVAPDNPDLLTDLGISYRGLREFDRALESFDRAQEIDSSHWQSLFNTVVVAGFDLKNLDRARQAMKSMEVIAPRPAGLTAEILTQLRQALDRVDAPASAEGSS